MASPRAAATLERASAALQSSQLVGLPEVIKLLRTLAHNSDEVSVSELAELIQNDAIVMAKVIGAANTFAYNPSAVPVSNVVQAIHVIGYERIRTLAMSLMLAEQTERSHSPEELRELSTMALAAGCIAQATAQNRMFFDKEQAFICASLRSFGRIVLASCMIDEYREALARSAEEPEEKVFRDIFGLTPIELGFELLRSSSLPQEILMTLKELPPNALDALRAAPNEQMRALADFSARLAERALDPRHATTDFARAAHELARRYQGLLPDLVDDVQSVVESAVGELNRFVHVFKLKHLPARSLVRLRNCRSAMDREHSDTTPAPAEPAPKKENNPAVARPAHAVVPAPNPPPGKSPASEAKPATPVPPAPALPEISAAPTEHAIQQVASLLRSPGFTTQQLHVLLLEAVGKGLAAPECLLFVSIVGKTEFSLAHGSGALWKELDGQAAIYSGERTVFGICLARHENITVHHARDPKLHDYLPGWLKGRAGLGAFVLLPLFDGERVHGVILAGWPEERRITLPPDLVQSAGRLITLICRVRAKLAG